MDNLITDINVKSTKTNGYTKTHNIDSDSSTSDNTKYLKKLSKSRDFYKQYTIR